MQYFPPKMKLLWSWSVIVWSSRNRWTAPVQSLKVSHFLTLWYVPCIMGLWHFWLLYDIHNSLGNGPHWVFLLICEKRTFENSVWEMLPFYLGIIVLKKKTFQYSNWSRINLAVDDISASNGIRPPGWHQWDYYPDLTFIFAKSLPPKSHQNHWKDQFTDAWYSIKTL